MRKKIKLLLALSIFSGFIPTTALADSEEKTVLTAENKQLVNDMARQVRKSLDNVDVDDVTDKTVNFIGDATEKAKRFGLIDAFINFIKALAKTLIDIIKGILDSLL